MTAVAKAGDVFYMTTAHIRPADDNSAVVGFRYKSFDKDAAENGSPPIPPSTPTHTLEVTMENGNGDTHKTSTEKLQSLAVPSTVESWLNSQQQEAGRPASSPALSAGRAGLGVPSSLCSSTSSLTTRGGGLGQQRLYLPGNSPRLSTRSSASPSVLRRLVLINSGGRSPRSSSPRPGSAPSPAPLRRPHSNPSIRVETSPSPALPRRQNRSCSSYTGGTNQDAAGDCDGGAGRGNMSVNGQSANTSFGSGHVNLAFDETEGGLQSGCIGPRGMDGGEMGEDEAFVDDMVVIERPIYTQSDFDEGFEGGKRPERNVRTWAQSKARKCELSCSCIGRFFRTYLPFLGIMREYNVKRDLLSDVIAGLTVGIMHIPQGMAYGQLSTLPPVFGLYVSFFPVLLYFFLGTSKHVSIGTFAVVSLMVGSAVDKGMRSHGLKLDIKNETIMEGNLTRTVMIDNSKEILEVKLKLAMAVTFAVGVIQLLLGLLRLGFLTVYLSDPLISGFTTGAACHVFTSQVKHIFGISMGRYSGAFKLIYSYRDIFMNLPETNAVTFIASLVCMCLLFMVKEYINNNPKIKPKLKMPVPIELIVVVLGTLISYFVKLEENYEVKIVGDIPVGIPPPNLYAFTYLTEVISDAIAIAIVAFAISVSMAKIFANKHDYAVDPNQELLAYAACNLFSSFFSSFVSAVSLSRSLVQENVGGKTQVTGLVSSCLVVVVLLVVGPYFETLPNCILASIILVALKGMFKQFLELKNLWGISIIDFASWLVTFSATVLLDVDLGLLVGVVFALLTVIIRSQRPYSCILGQVPGTDIYKDISVYKVAEETPNIKIFRFDSALFFANSEFFKSSLFKLTVNPNHLKKKQKKLNKKKKREDKELLNVTVDSTGSSFVKPAAETTTKGSNGSLGPTLTVPGAAGSNQDEDGVSTSGARDSDTLTDVQYIIIDCSTMSYVDSMGVKVLRQIITELKTFNITVYLAQCKSSVREMFETTGFYNTSSRHYMFITIHDAVVSAQLNQWSISTENEEATNAINNNASNDGNDDDHDGDAAEVEDGKATQEETAGDKELKDNSVTTASSQQGKQEDTSVGSSNGKNQGSKDMERTEV